MYRKIISALLLLITLTSLIPTTSAQVDITHNLTPTSLARVSAPLNLIPTASANTEIQRDPKCVEADRTFFTGLGDFLIANAIWGAGFLISDALIGVVARIPIIGGIADPINKVVDFLKTGWKQALIWGVIASFFNIFAGWLIEAGIALNLTLAAGNPLVSYGGPIILQIANFGLVLSIIIVGIATILRIEKDKYSADKLLIKLIVGIILVNLTIPIATSIAHVGTMVTEAMFRASAPCPQNITHQFYAWNLYEQFKILLGISVSREEARVTQPISDEERIANHLQLVTERALIIEIRARQEKDAYINRLGPEGRDSRIANKKKEIGLQIDRSIRAAETLNRPYIPQSHFPQYQQQIHAIIAAAQDRNAQGSPLPTAPAPSPQGVSKIISDIILDLLALIASGIMSFIAGFTFLLLAIFLLIRFVILMLLIIFSPLIWLGFIFAEINISKAGNIWKAWWSEFLRWTFFGPIIVLFLAFTSQYLNNIGAGAGTVNVLVQLGHLIAVLIIAAIGIYATSKMGGVASKMTISAASSGLGYVSNMAQGWVRTAQLNTEAELRRLRLAGQSGTLRARAFSSTSRALGATVDGINLEKGPASSLLAPIGIKPQIKSPDDNIIRGRIRDRIVRNITLNPDTALLLSNDDLQHIGTHGSLANKININTALSSFTPTNPAQVLEYRRVTRQIARLRGRALWP